MKNKKLLSLVIPAFKQEETIAKDLMNLTKILKEIPYDYEIIVVVDGYLDKTYEIAKKFHSKKVKILGYEKNQGKGYAVRYGFEKSKGDIIGFIDAGMDIDPHEISIALNIMEWNKADIVIGSKLHPESKVNYPFSRKVLSWGYRMLIKILFRLSVKDTQVGLKFFRRKVVKDVFPRITVKAFAFDVEVLASAISLGYGKIIEVPIKLHFKQGSITNTNFWKISFLALMDTFSVFYRLKILRKIKNAN